MLTPHEFKRTRAARPRPDLGGDDLADLGTTCWCVGRFSTDKHLSIGKAHAVRPKIGLYWPPVVARVGRRPWRCRCGLPYWWPPVLADAVAVRRGGGRPCGWCTGWRPLPLVSVRRAGGRSVVVSVHGRGGRFRGRWRPFGRPLVHWSAVVLSWPVAARLGLVCLPCQLVAFRRRLWPVAAGVRCWSLRALLRRRRSRWPCRWPSLLVCWCRCHCGVPWPVVRVAGRQYGPPCGGVLVVSLRRALLGRVPFPSVRAGVRRGRSLAVSVRPCWCAGVRSVAGVRFLPCSVAVVARLGRRWCWCPSLVLAARVGLVLGLADWLAVWALPVAGGGGWRCLRLRWCLPCQ